MSDESRTDLEALEPCPRPSDALYFEVVEAAALSTDGYGAILDLCTRAYRKPFAQYLEPHVAPTHMLAYCDGQLVAHALWVTRWFQIDTSPLLRTAYVEAVATDPGYQGRGFASALMRRLVTEVASYDLAGLGPSDPAFYTRLGWHTWRGPLSIRTERSLQRTPTGRVMVHALPNTPPFDLAAPLSAEWRHGALW